MNGSKRRKRGPRASAYFSFESDEPVPVPRHSVGQASARVSASGASCASLPNARGGAEMNGSRSASDGEAEHSAPHTSRLVHVDSSGQNRPSTPRRRQRTPTRVRACGVQQAVATNGDISTSSEVRSEIYMGDLCERGPRPDRDCRTVVARLY